MAFPRISAGISSINVAAAEAGGGFSSLAAGASAAVAAINPVTLAIAAVGAAFIGWKVYQNYWDGLIKTASETATQFNGTKTSIDDNINKVTELREALASGSLSEQEAANAKSELLSIQESLTDSYGEQVAGIDLINGSLTEQIELLDKVSQKEAESYKNENKKAIKKAEKEMEKDDRNAYLGSFYDNGTDESEAIKASIKKLQDKYGDDVLVSELNDNGITVDVHFVGDAVTEKEVMNDFMTEMEEIEDTYKTGTADLMSDYASDGLKKADKVIDKYQDIYEAAKKADLVSDDRLYMDSDHNLKTASEWLRDYTKAIDDYNTALASGDYTEIEKAKTAFDDVNGSVSELLLNTDMGVKYGDTFGEVKSQLDQATISANNFKNALSDKGNTKIQGFIDELKDLNLTDTDFKYVLETDGIQDGEDAVNGLSDAAEKAGVSTDQLISWLVELGVISSSTAEAVDTTKDAVSDITAQVENATSALSGIQKATSVLTSQSTGKSISIDDFNSDELKDYQGALEYVNGTMQLNAEKVREIAKAKADEQVAINNSNKALEQAKYLENAKQIEQLRASLASASDSEKASIQESIDALLSENSAIADTCKQYDLLSSSIQEAVGSYQNWLNTQSSSDYGDMASDAVSAIQRIRDTYDSNSDVFGDYGSKKFEAAIDFIVPDSVDSDDLGAIESYIADFKQYLKFDDNGAVDGLNIDKFLENSVNAGLMKYSEDDGFQVLGGKKMEDFAEGLNMSSGMVQAFFDELQLKGADFDWGDEAVKTIGDLAVEANEAAESLRQVDGNSDLKIKMDVSDLSTTEEQISALDATIAEMDAVKARPDVDASSIENANSVIQYCLTQKQLLSQPDVMRVDTSQVEGEISNAISLLQQFQTATNDLEIKQKVGADTTEAESKVNSLTSEIEGISPDIKAKLGIDSTSVDSIKTSIAGLSAKTINVKANVDASAIDGYNPDSKKCDVIYDPKTDALPESFDAINRDVNYVPHTGSLPESFTTLTRYVNYVKTGAVDVNGTAHVSGTAKAGGDWGTAPGGRTLVGELGREIVVDPHTGRWYTVGDNGAEFRDIPAGAIVFNHVQSESLLENGYVAGRASALVSGTALVTGGYKPYKPSSSSTSRTPSKSSSKPSSSSSGSKPSSGNSGGSSGSGGSSSTSSKQKHAEQTFDWVARSLTKFKNAVENVANTINDYVSSAFKKSQLSKQIKGLQDEIDANKRGQQSYMDKANSIANGYTYYYTPEGSDSETSMNITIPEAYKKAVQGGYWNIEDMDTTSDFGKALAEAIQKYQDYYDKATDCAQAVQDLYNEQLKVFEEWANMPTENAEKKIDSLTRKINGLKSAMTALSTGGSGLQSLSRQVQSDTPGLSKAQSKLNSAKQKQAAAKTKYSTASQKYSTATKKVSSAKNTMTKNGNSVISTAKKSKVSAKKQKEIQSAVKSGKAINTKGLTGSTLKAAQAYNSSRSTYTSAVSAQKTAKSQKDSAATAYKTTTQNVKTQQQNVNNIKSNLTSAQKTVVNKATNSKAYVAQNSLLDTRLSLSKKENSARQLALKQARKNMDSYNNAVVNRDKAKSALLNTTGKITIAQRNAIKANKKVDTSNIKDKKLKAQLEAYNKWVDKADPSKKTILQNALDEAQSNADQSQAEYAAMRVTNEQEKFQNIQNYYDGWNNRYSNYTEAHQKKYDLSEAHGDYTNTKKFDIQIADLQKQRKYKNQEATDLQAQLDKSVKSGIIKKGSQEWLEMTNQILEAQNAVSDFDTQIEQAKQDKITAVYEKMFDRAIEKAEQFKDKIDAINSLITNDMMVDKDTGNLTEMGALSITMNASQLSTTLKNLQTYVKKRQRIIDDFKKDAYGESEYDEYMKENDSAMQSALKDANSYREAIVSIVTNQAKAVQDALFKEMDARKKALKKKKEYYDYDKKISDKTDEIELIKQQIRGLEGLTDAESKAQKARLEASLKEKQDDLDDTVRDHIYDITVNGLDDLETQLSEDFDKWSNKLSSDLENMSDAISSAISESGLNYNDMQKAIGKILKQFGLNPDDYFTSADKSATKNSLNYGTDIKQLKGYAKGTDRVGSNRIALTNENGREIIVTKDGWITPLEASDMVIPHDITETLIDMATKQQNYSMTGVKIPEFKVIDTQGGGNVTLTYGSLITVQGDVTRDALPDLQTIVKKASDYTQNEIRKNKRRFG